MSPVSACRWIICVGSSGGARQQAWASVSVFSLGSPPCPRRMNSRDREVKDPGPEKTCDCVRQDTGPLSFPSGPNEERTPGSRLSVLRVRQDRVWFACAEGCEAWCEPRWDPREGIRFTGLWMQSACGRMTSGAKTKWCRTLVNCPNLPMVNCPLEHW